MTGRLTSCPQIKAYPCVSQELANVLKINHWRRTEMANVEGQLDYVLRFLIFFFVLQLDDDVLTR